MKKKRCKSSRRTTFWGTLAAIAGAVATFSPDPTSKTIAAATAAVATGMLGVCSRDHKLTSRDAGLHEAQAEVPITILPDSSQSPSPPRPKSAPLLLAIIGALSFVGCSTLDNPQSLQNKAKALGLIATTEILEDRPDWRPAFEVASADLKILSQAETIELAEVIAIVNRLPVEKLQSGKTALYVQGAVLCFSDELGTVALDNPELLRRAVTGLYQGIDLATANAP